LGAHKQKKKAQICEAETRLKFRVKNPPFSIAFCPSGIMVTLCVAATFICTAVVVFVPCLLRRKNGGVSLEKQWKCLRRWLLLHGLCSYGLGLFMAHLLPLPFPRNLLQQDLHPADVQRHVLQGGTGWPD